MSIRSRSTLHALRQVLQRPSTSQRHFAAAALVREEEDRQRLFSPSYSEPVSQPTPVNFLEDTDSEYLHVADTLPRRYSRPHEIPWPTVFAPKVKVAPPKVCDGLYSLVQRGDYASARTVHDELRAAGFHPQHRKVYLEPAQTALKAEPPDREGFLVWVSLYPNRPAVRSNEFLQAEWLPIIDHLRRDHTLEFDFLEQFLITAGRLGLLPVVFSPFIMHIALFAPPQRSYEIFRKALDAYYASTTSSTSASPRAMMNRAIVDDQADEWWNKFIRRLVMSGWKDEVLQVWHGIGDEEKARINWDAKTLSMLAEVDSENESMSSATTVQHSLDLPLPRRIRQALSHKITPTDLAALLSDIGEMAETRPTLLTTFANRFAFKRWPDRKSVHPRYYLLLQAEIINLRNQHKHYEAIGHLMSNCLWLGVPETEATLRLARVVPPSNRVPYATNHLITTVLPSLVHVLPNRTRNLADFHQQYLTDAAVLPPSLQPTDATHGQFLRLFTYHCGAVAAVEAIKRIVRAGMDPSEKSFAALLFFYARRGHYDEVDELLDDMENRRVFVDDYRYPAPSARTYSSLSLALARKRDEDSESDLYGTEAPVDGDDTE